MVNWQKTYGLKLIDSDSFHANVGIGSNFCNGVRFPLEFKQTSLYIHFKLARIIWGLAFDKIGYKKSTIIIGICVAIGISSLPLLQFLGKIKTLSLKVRSLILIFRG